MLEKLKVNLTPCDMLLVALAIEERMVHAQMLIERDKCNPSVRLILEKDLNKYGAIHFKIYEALDRMVEEEIREGGRI